MYIHVYGKRLRVAVERDLRDDDGNMTYGLFRPASLTIALDLNTPRDQRRHVLLHEIGHAVDFLLCRPDPNDGEGRQNRQATIEGQFAVDLDAHGGERAIHAMFGDSDLVLPEDPGVGPVIVNEDETGEYPTAVSCCRCHTEFAGRVVRTGRPVWDPKIDGYAVWRVLECGACDHASRWRQLATVDGVPLPRTIVPPVLTRMYAEEPEQS